MSYANPQAQADVSRTTPEMQNAFGVVSQFQPVVTSVMHGGHVKDSAHYAGRAIDVGAFGRTPVGRNATTWQALTDAIGSHRFEKIGTIPQLADDPRLQAWARENGVELFVDEGSGPHIHFQVGE